MKHPIDFIELFGGSPTPGREKMNEKLNNILEKYDGLLEAIEKVREFVEEGAQKGTVFHVSALGTDGDLMGLSGPSPNIDDFRDYVVPEDYQDYPVGLFIHEEGADEPRLIMKWNNSKQCFEE